jgi:methylenetetrahydrofolate dehydrogenase (NADP+)/methenyltetrahydrofolate cyclohydrolase
MRNESAVRVERLKSRGIVPGLAVVIVGDDPASQVYVRNKAVASGGIGMHSEVHALSADTTQQQLLAFIHSLNANRAVHGILVQLPLPSTSTAAPSSPPSTRRRTWTASTTSTWARSWSERRPSTRARRGA